MSDLDPHPTAFATDLVDPAVTRLVSRDRSGAAASLLHRVGPVATSISFVVPEESRTGAGFAEALRGWRPDTLRVEVLALAGQHDRRPPPPPSGAPGPAVPLRTLTRPLGGRAALLAEAAEAAECEFVVVTSSDELPYHAMLASMGHMWAEGCDAALVGEDGGPSQGAAAPAVDAAATLSSWLGPSGPPERLVVLRRWVARWLFHEVTRAIDPWDEVADRARLLGIGIVHLRDRTARR